MSLGKNLEGCTVDENGHSLGDLLEIYDKSTVLATEYIHSAKIIRFDHPRIISREQNQINIVDLCYKILDQSGIYQESPYHGRPPYSLHLPKDENVGFRMIYYFSLGMNMRYILFAYRYTDGEQYYFSYSQRGIYHSVARRLLQANVEHYDAVKREFLKHLPDELIRHL